MAGGMRRFHFGISASVPPRWRRWHRRHQNRTTRQQNQTETSAMVNLSRRCLLACAALAAASVHAQSDNVKIGLILPMTGQQASTGRQIEAAVKLWQAQNGTKAGGKTVEIILKDDAAVPDTTRRLAQELVVNDKVTVLAGFGVTPAAMATAPIATQSKTPMVVMAAGTSAITQASPFVVRTSFTLPQATVPLADWAAKNGIKKAVSLVADF